MTAPHRSRNNRVGGQRLFNSLEEAGVGDLAKHVQNKAKPEPLGSVSRGQ